jgi:hypothetical protein
MKRYTLAGLLVLAVLFVAGMRNTTFYFKRQK